MHLKFYVAVFSAIFPLMFPVAASASTPAELSTRDLFAPVHAEITTEYSVSSGRYVRVSGVEAIPAYLDIGEGVLVPDVSQLKVFVVTALVRNMKAAMADYDGSSCEKKGVKGTREKIAERLLEQVVRLRGLIKGAERVFAARSLSGLSQDASVSEALGLADKLAGNIKENAKCYDYEQDGNDGFKVMVMADGGSSFDASQGMAASGSSMAVTTGGAQDAGKARQAIEDGRVPAAVDFKIGGFLKDFDFSSPTVAPGKPGEIQFTAGTIIDRRAGLAFVPVTMGLVPTEKQALGYRSKDNLVIALDISGSMGTMDRQGQTRLDWAKSASTQTITAMRDGSVLSIVLFDDKVETLIEHAILTKDNRSELIAKVMSVQPRGATNLEQALIESLRLAKAKAFELRGKPEGEDFVHNVLLISDAQANMGETDGPALHSLVAQAATDNVGLITIGIGRDRWDGFNTELVEAMSKSPGGSYTFVASAEQMTAAVSRLPYMLNPLAINLRAQLELKGIEGAKLLKVYGTAANEDATKPEGLISVPTLLKAGEGRGGAIVAVYKLPFKEIITENNDAE